MNIRSEVARDSNRPSQAMPGINDIEQAKAMNGLATSSSTTGIATGDFETLDSKIASGSMQILHGLSETNLHQKKKRSQKLLIVGDGLPAFQDQRCRRYSSG